MEKVVSPFAIKVRKMVDDQLDELGGLTDVGLKVLDIYLKEAMKITNYTLDINWTNRVIIIHVLDSNNKEVFLRVKNTDMLKFVAVKMGTPDYTITFASKT